MKILENSDRDRMREGAFVIKRSLALTSLAFSSMTLGLYFFGAFLLARFQGLSWETAPVFSAEIVRFPVLTKIISGITITAGTALIYFVPGTFVAKHFARAEEGWTEVFLKGFLINYFFYYFSTTFFKTITGQTITREVVVLLSGAGILLSYLTALIPASPKAGMEAGLPGKIVHSKGFLACYTIFLACVFYAFREKIFFAHFDGDGAEQYWLAQSVQTSLLPTAYRFPITIIPQFVFAPSIYLNMFAQVLFGSAEFVIKIEILVAFIALGLILKAWISEAGHERKRRALEWIPFFLYLFLFFIIIAFCSGYYSPTDLAKSNETLQLALLLSGFYLLTKKKKDGLAAIFFVLGAMIRYNGLFMITVFLAVFSVLFRRWRCFVLYLLGATAVVLALHALLIPSAFKFTDMIHALLADGEKLRVQGFDLSFILAYLRNYFIFTAGLSVFFILGMKNRYVLLMFITSIVFLFLPVRSDCVPAHYFVPILMFPLMSYYLWE